MAGLIRGASPTGWGQRHRGRLRCRHNSTGSQVGCIGCSNAARLVAVNEGVAAIVTGELSSGGNGYTLAVKAIDSVTGKTLAAENATAASKDEILLDIPKVIVPIRQALGDTMPQSVQIEKAAGAFSPSSLAAVHQYGIAMEQLLAGNSEDAIRSFSNAIALDPNFARAYGGMA